MRWELGRTDPRGLLFLVYSHSNRIHFSILIKAIGVAGMKCWEGPQRLLQEDLSFEELVLGDYLKSNRVLSLVFSVNLFCMRGGSDVKIFFPTILQ